MEAGTQARLDSLDSRRLPVLPPGFSHLLQTLTDASMDFQRLAHIIGRFPMIAARLIALANSAWSSPVSRVISLEAACARLGFGVVRSTSIALAVASPFDPNRCPAFDAQRFLCRALLVADAACWLAEVAINGPAPETARAAGLLHHLGLLWLADQLPRETHQVLLRHRETPTRRLDQLLVDSLGFDYCDAGGALGEHWGLPAPLVTAMAHHRTPDASSVDQGIALIVGQGVVMAKAAEQGSPRMAPDLLELSLGIGRADADNIFSRIAIQAVQTQELAQTLFGN